MSQLNPEKQCQSPFFLTVERLNWQKSKPRIYQILFSSLSFLAVAGIGEISHHYFFLIFMPVL